MDEIDSLSARSPVYIGEITLASEPSWPTSRHAACRMLQAMRSQPWIRLPVVAVAAARVAAASAAAALMRCDAAAWRRPPPAAAAARRAARAPAAAAGSDDVQRCRGCGCPAMAAYDHSAIPPTHTSVPCRGTVLRACWVSRHGPRHAAGDTWVHSCALNANDGCGGRLMLGSCVEATDCARRRCAHQARRCQGALCSCVAGGRSCVAGGRSASQMAQQPRGPA
jgi:hypothetical protein